MGGVQLGAGRRYGNSRAIVKGPCHPAFWMRADLIWGMRKSKLHDVQIQQVVGTTSGKYAQSSREHIHEGSRVAIQTVQTQEHRGWGKPKSGTDHFSSLAALIAWRAHSLEPAMGSRQGVRLRQCSLTSRLSGSIHIDDQPPRTCPVEQATRGRKGSARKHILLKTGAQGFHVCVSTCANAATSPIQSGMAGEGEGWIWMMTVGGAVSRIPPSFLVRASAASCADTALPRLLA